MHRILGTKKFWDLTSTTIICVLGLLGAAIECNGDQRHALLVGCSEYQNSNIRPLPGAANDVADYQQFLHNELGFENVETLVGWPSESTKRPTHSNITAAFERLIDAVEPNSQVVILLTGHGHQFPLPESQTDVLAAQNPEPDGFDEGFLAADYSAGTNMILDNQIGEWLDRLRAKGAHVWITFDSCFSGTMMRSGSNETPREIDARSAGISKAAIESARKRASSVKRAESTQQKSPRHDGLDLPKDASSKGSVVAFYAAQDFETAPEVTRPIGADTKDPKHKHGLLSYHLLDLLRNRTEATTYRDLGWKLVGRYRGDGRRRPTPFFEGDLDREVLGLKEWPRQKPLLLEKIGNEVRLAAGELSRVYKDTILSVHPSNDKEFKTTLGHIRVVNSTATACAIEPVGFGASTKATPISELPDGAQCRIVSQSLGAAKIKIAFLPSNIARYRPTIEAIGSQLNAFSQVDNAVVEVVMAVDEADWWVVVATPEYAKKTFNIELKETSLIMIEATTENAEISSSGLVHVEYRLSDRKQAASIHDDLKRIAAWKDMWRIANAYGDESPLVEFPAVKLEVGRLSSAKDKSRGELLETSQVNTGDFLVARVVNTSFTEMWYTVFFLNGRYGIEFVRSGALPARKGLETRTEHLVERIEVDGSFVGAEGYLVVAVSQDEHVNKPDYQFLAQSEIGKPASRSVPNITQLRSQFERVLFNAVNRHGQSRGTVSPDNPNVDSWTWTTVNKGDQP